ncbi:hypothetical protein PUNSTDRAFT_43947 [Punctularia strigosozonata HHB-11173 SS5]|uniref:uncharacterized protein n=1 Tax=Punctularia strigosozonata (strain HHB-11173) TaxID=741275 RepID=UPI00044164CE|nr:uncharacterized protein PUNSTDRAFT_43947 [Punctularia strigosozonata HHB-11173 SS5]EIN09618.1 hypothetical protein PUNSTDRAFT_43947 [Punctularia strigosozonata HHB-11173 SS5]
MEYVRDKQQEQQMEQDVWNQWDVEMRASWELEYEVRMRVLHKEWEYYQMQAALSFKDKGKGLLELSTKIPDYQSKVAKPMDIYPMPAVSLIGVKSMLNDQMQDTQDYDQ